MNAVALAVVMLASSAGASPALETSRAMVLPAPSSVDHAVTTSLDLPQLVLKEPSRPVWRRASLQPAPAKSAKRISTAGRVLVVAVGALGGWMAGGAIGYAATSKPDDDVSGLRGVMIGAPIGSVVGALVGYRLTK